jgi:ABC-type sulfate transport system permease component
MKIVLVVLLLLVILSLFSGLFFMYRNKGDQNRMVNALKLRVAFSILAFLIAIAGFAFGWFPKT